MRRALPLLLLACLAAGSAQAIKLSKERMVFQTGDGVEFADTSCLPAPVSQRQPEQESP